MDDVSADPAESLVPGMNGGVGVTGQSPCAARMSVWHRPVALDADQDLAMA